MAIGTRLDIRSTVRRRSCDIARETSPSRYMTSVNGNKNTRKHSTHGISASKMAQKGIINNGGDWIVRMVKWSATFFVVVVLFLCINSYKAGTQIKIPEPTGAGGGGEGVDGGGAHGQPDIRPTDKNKNSITSLDCSIDRVNFSSLKFDEYRNKKPVLIRFEDSAFAWTDSNMWKIQTLNVLEKKWRQNSNISAKKDDEQNSLGQFLKLSKDSFTSGSKSNRYILPTDFIVGLEMTNELKLKEVLKVKGDNHTSISVGAVSNYVSFTRGSEMWSALITGKKKWFIYPRETTPPGGVWSLFSPVNWLSVIYPRLKDNKRPETCIQNPGDILYIPENFYQGCSTLKQSVEVTVSSLKHNDVTFDAIDTSIKISFKETTDKTQKLLQVLPKNTEVMNTLAEYYVASKTKEAAKILANIIKIDRFNTKAYARLAAAREKQGNAKEATKLFKQAVKYKPGPAVYMEYGDFLIRQGKPTEAMDQFLQAYSLRPDIEEILAKISETGKTMKEAGEFFAKSKKTQRPQNKVKRVEL